MINGHEWVSKISTYHLSGCSAAGTAIIVAAEALEVLLGTVHGIHGARWSFLFNLSHHQGGDKKDDGTLSPSPLSLGLPMDNYTFISLPGHTHTRPL